MGNGFPIERSNKLILKGFLQAMNYDELKNEFEMLGQRVDEIGERL
jgi:hypothetical protein